MTLAKPRRARVRRTEARHGPDGGVVESRAEGLTRHVVCHYPASIAGLCTRAEDSQGGGPEAILDQMQEAARERLRAARIGDNVADHLVEQEVQDPPHSQPWLAAKVLRPSALRGRLRQIPVRGRDPIRPK